MSGVIATIIAIGGFLLGNALGAWFSVADRLAARRARRGSMAAVSVSYDDWVFGTHPIPITHVGAGGYVDEEDAVGFPLAVTNGSDDKISNVEYGIRWNEGGELQAAHVPVLQPGERHTATAWGAMTRRPSTLKTSTRFGLGDSSSTFGSRISAAGDGRTRSTPMRAHSGRAAPNDCDKRG